MFDVTSEVGAANVSVAHVVERSGVSRRTFYETFTDREDCFLAAFEDALALASQRVLPAYRSEDRWRDRIRASVIELLSFLDEEPVIGRLLIVESLTGSPRTLERRTLILARLAAAIDEGRDESGAAKDLPLLTAEGVIGGALSILHARIYPAGRPPLIELANVLVSMIVLPYLGAGAARRELERTVEPRPKDQRTARLLDDPFKDNGMRLTYRTVRALMVIAEYPHASNRTIGESRGHQRPGPDIEDARPPATTRPDHEHGIGSRSGCPQRMDAN